MLKLSFDTANRFGPSRSAVMSTQGMVATSQPLATLAGLDILRQGGNAVDAAVAAAAMLNVIEPMSTGVGGDVFALIYQASSGRFFGLNGSGRSPYAATLEEYQRRLGADPLGQIPLDHILAVTVPGTVDGWASALERFGRMTLADVLKPAIQAAEEGFAVAPQTAQTWALMQELLARHPDSASTWLLADGRAPRVGERFRNPRLARTLRMIAEGGRDLFYRGELADAIVQFSGAHGGLLTLADLMDHRSVWVEPLAITYRGYEILQLPPNTQGLVVLETLRTLEEDDLAAMGHNTPDTVHLQLEALKLAFVDRNRYITDPEFYRAPLDQLLSHTYAKQQRARISMRQAIHHPPPGVPSGGDTVYLCVVDAEGNVVSFINSIFHPFGSGLTVGETGIVLQNRGASFSLDPAHVNVIAPHKRTRHTIIPAMIADQGRPLVAFGVMGADMQAQGQVQFVCNIIDFGMNVQDALDAPRWQYLGAGADIALEAGMPAAVWHELARRGHQIKGSDAFFGGGQAILIHPEYGTCQGGSDPRRDGCAMGY